MTETYEVLDDQRVRVVVRLGAQGPSKSFIVMEEPGPWPRFLVADGDLEAFVGSYQDCARILGEAGRRMLERQATPSGSQAASA